MKYICLLQIIFAVARLGTTQGYGAKILIISPSSGFINEGDKLKLQCVHFSGFRYTWYKNGKHLSNTDTNTYETIVDSATGGTYTCQPYYGWLKSESVEVVTIAPDMNVHLSIVPRAALTGDRINMVCWSHNWRESETLLWYRNGKVIPSLRGLRKNIRYAKPADEASYRCGLRKGYRVWLSPPVNVTVTDLVIAFQADPPLVLEGDFLELTCRHKYTFNLKHSVIEFYKEGSQTRFFSTTVKNETATYLVQTNSSKDSGLYCCKFRHISSRCAHVQVNERFPEPILRTESEIFEGQELRLECSVETKQAGISLRYSFYRDGKRLPSYRDVYSVFSRVASLDDSGGYLCVAQGLWYSISKKSETVNILVKEAFTKPTLSAAGQIFEGEPLKVECRVESNPSSFTLRYEFFKDSHALGSQSSENCYKREAAQLEDSGTYQCRVAATNGVDNGVTKSSDTFYLKVNLIPVQKPQLTVRPGTELLEGDAAWFRCSVSEGSLPITYRFYKDSGEVLHRETSRVTNALYEVAGVRPSSGGRYHCEVENRATEGPLQSEFVTLAVIVPVANALLISKPNTTVIGVGHRLVLQCHLKAGTTPQFHWYRDNQPLGNASQSYHFSADGTEFIIHPFQKSDEGRYHCVATNRGIDDDIFNATSNSIEVNVPAASYTTEVTASVLTLLLLAAAIALICFKLRRPKQDNPTATSPPLGPEPTSQVPSATNFEYAVVGSHPNAENNEDNADLVYSVVTIEKPKKAEDTEADADLVYSVVTIEKPKKAGRGECSTSITKVTQDDSEDYCITYATLSHSKAAENLGGVGTEWGEGTDTNLYENLPRK